MMNSKRIYSSSDSSKSCSSASSVGIIRIRGGGGSGGSGGSGSPPSHADLFRRAECSAPRDAGVPSTGTAGGRGGGGVIVLQQQQPSTNNLNNGAGLSGFLKGKELSFGGGGEILLHDMEKTGCSAQEGQRDRGSIIGVLKRASPTHCLTTNGGVLPPDGLSNNSSSNNSMHLDIRNPGKRVELLTNGFHHHHQAALPGRGSNGAIVTPAVPPEDRQQQSHPSCHSIPVPRHRKPSGHADKEVMAATVLTSLSTSPLVLHPASTTPTVPEPASRGWKEALSASYSSSTSGNWSWDASDQSVPSTPSPPLTNDAAKGFLLSSHGDDVSEDATDGTHFLFEDPIPRKRKNSMKVMFKCLWKNCEKVLSTSSGIQRHVRTVHLGRNSDSDYSDGEEDFYYSEIEVNMDSLTEGLSSLTPTSPTTAGPPPFFPSPSVVLCGAAHVPRSEHISVVSGHQPPPPQQQPLPAPPQPLEHHPAPTLLSQSAPSTLCHIRTDHAYQATAPVSVPVAAGLAGPGCAAGWNSGTTGSVNGTGSLSVSWQSSPPVIFKGLPPGPVQAHVRTVSIGEKRQPVSNTHAAATKNHVLINPVPKPAPGTRKPRGEAKKCRKVYGMEKRDMWCTACRWKKACQRFTD